MTLTPQALDFLFENRLKDSKEWYHEHKEQHTELVVKPFREFVVEMQPYISEIDKELMCNPGKISRIYRDTRFTKDKSVFRDNVWFTFSRGKEIYEGYPAFFFDFSPRGFTYGCGYYKAASRSMEEIRNLILKKDKSFVSAQKALSRQKIFTMEGDLYKKNRFPDASPENCEWLNRKTVCFIAQSNNFDLLFSEGLAEKIGNDFLLLKPVYDFLIKAESFAAKQQ